jgi:hypothetical protein
LGYSVGLALEEPPADFGLGAVLAEEEEAPPAPGEFCAPPELGGFEDPGNVFSVLGVRGLSAFGDSPLAFCVEESGWISLGALHKGSSVRKWSRMGDSHKWAYIFDRRVRIFFRPLEGGVRGVESLAVGSLILIPLFDLPVVFLAFFDGVSITGALRFPTRVFDPPALASVVGLLADSLLGGRAETVIVGIGISPSNPGMGEMKLSKACI